MFDHPLFDNYSFEDIPLDRDLFLMDEIWMGEYEKSMLTTFGGGEGENVGYISYAAARSVRQSDVSLSWYPTFQTRFHEVSISLPRSHFVACVGCSHYDEKPHIFVKSGWLEHLYLRSFSVFALIDAAGVKNALNNGHLTREKLIRLRDRIDTVADQHPDISFISFADSLLLKSNWSVGLYNSDVEYTYEPEVFVRLFPEIQLAYREVLGLNVYAILTQGNNAYYEDPLLHISTSRNHISLNSLGLPFAQLMSIEKAARAAIRNKIHEPVELYMDTNFFRSLNFELEFRRDSCGKNTYQDPMTTEDSEYFFADCQHVIENLRDLES